MQSIDCPSCKYPNAARARFCNECGSPLHLTPCDQCGAYNHVDDAQCSCCGVLLTSMRAPAQTAQLDAGAEGFRRLPVGLDEQVLWLEQELRRFEQEESKAPLQGLDAVDETRDAAGPQPEPSEPELDASAEAPGAAGIAPSAFEHELDASAAAATAREREVHDTVDQAPDASARRSRALDPAVRTNERRLRGAGRAAVRARLPDGRWLFTDLAGEPRSRWREYAAGALAALLVLGIVAGGYVYYHTSLMPMLPVVAHDAPATDRPFEAGVPPLVKEATVFSTLGKEPQTKALANASVASDRAGAPRLAPAAAVPAAREADAPAARETELSAKTSNSGAVAADPPRDTAPARAAEKTCPPAVDALALCDWMTHAERKAG